MLSTLTKERMEALRYEAGERLYRKFHSMTANRKGRDYFLYQNNDHDVAALRSVLRVTRSARKSLGQIINSMTKEHKHDSMALLAETEDYQRRHGSSFEWFRNYVIRKFGQAVVDNLRFKSCWDEPVWVNEDWFRRSKWYMVHKVHQSEDEPTMIAYNRTIDNIKRDIQTRTKPGKYLTQFFSDVLTQDEIRMWAEKQIAHASCEAELKFVENDAPDLWVEVYENGPHSCMKGDDSVRVYCYPGNGLRLAYLETDDEIVARAIVRDHYIKTETADLPTIEPVKGDNHGWLRIYSTEQRWDTKLRDLLDAAGYSKQINLHGVKLKRIDCEHDCNDGVVCPYIDAGDGGTQMVTIYEKFIEVDQDGDIQATNTCGSIPLHDGRECDSCGGNCDEDDMTYVESDDRTVCEHCLNDQYTYAYGRRYQDYFPNEDVIRCESDGEYYLEQSASYHDVYQCRVTDDWYHIDDLVTLDAGSREGETVHHDEAVRDSDGNWMYQGDATEIDGEWVDNDYVDTCHITGDDIDIRKAVAIKIGEFRTRHNVNITYTKRVYIGADSFNLELIRENFVRCGDLLLPRGYYGNEINDVTEPSNIEYGDEFGGDQFEDLFVEEAEHLLAA